MSKQVSEADAAIACAAAFGRTPPAWAVEAQRRELREAGEPTMSLSEAVDVEIGATFGRVPSEERLAEARAITAKGAGAGTVSSASLQSRLTAVMGQVAAQAERTMGMSSERAQLEAQSQALRCRETTKTVSEALTQLEAHLDAMMKAPGVGRATFVDGKRVRG